MKSFVLASRKPISINQSIKKFLTRLK